LADKKRIDTFEQLDKNVAGLNVLQKMNYY